MTTAAAATSRFNNIEVTRVRAVIGTALVAVVVNLAIWLIGLAAGGDFMVTDDVKGPISAAPVGVIVMTVIPIVVGMTAAALLSLRWGSIIRVAQVIGAILPIATIAMTIGSDFDGVSTVSLSLMHIVVAATVVLGLQAIRNKTA
ncbi:DUF6069 family protein [Antrihabitans cavernicola]|uniref:Uncharacterized protein n=1 Tax=Antrihabitans cavernicola TaxID=2495913 RepID=A0A5A7S260_9NOCA|nr:DUF6069 family protein [Spelaeibacter cavernicola]KAA0017979.1 hypothetical protein FOY51_24655 [Spelaeibacter cavernicola]